MTILSIAGRRRTGKTVSAEILCSIGHEMGIPIQKHSFADPIRQEFARVLKISEKRLLDPDTKEDYREEMIAFSEEKKKEDPFIWINKLFEEITPGSHVVIDDMRSLHELEYIVKLGGKPYKVEASKETREKRGYKYNSVIDDHLSETEMDLCFHTFYTLGGSGWFNNKSIEELRAELTVVFKDVFLPRQVFV